VQQVERRVVLAEQVVADHGVPDQVGAAQQVEGRGHVAAVEVAALARLADQLELGVVDEHLEVAGALEIDLRGEEGDAGDFGRLVAAGEHGERRGERGAGDAVADRVHRGDREPLADDIDRFHLRADVVVPGDLGHRLVGRAPRDHEHGHPLLDAPAHEALLRVEVEDVEAVDPRREDQQRGWRAPARSSARTG
jgi:hypothetical protein